MWGEILDILKLCVLVIVLLFRNLFRKPTPYPLVGKTVVVTGAGNGIGRALALQLAQRKNTVVLVDINEKAANEVAQEIKQMGPECFVEVCDVSDKQQVAATAQRIKQTAGDVDMLVNNAGVTVLSSLLEMTDSEIERVIQINLLSLFWTTRAFLPDMINRRTGYIVNISSGLGFSSCAKLSTYCASKSGVLGLHGSLRRELQSQKLADCIGMTAVCPGFVQTRMVPNNKTGAGDRLFWQLTPEYLASQIIKAVESRQELLALPPAILYVKILHSLLPERVVIWMSGAGTAAKEARGTGHFSTLQYLSKE